MVGESKYKDLWQSNPGLFPVWRIVWSWGTRSEAELWKDGLALLLQLPGDSRDGPCWGGLCSFLLRTWDQLLRCTLYPVLCNSIQLALCRALVQAR